MRSNTRTASAVAAAVLCAAALVGCSDNGDSGSESRAEAPADFAAAPTTPSGTVSPSVNPSDEVGTISAKKGPLGTILVDDKGRTLYLFEADKTKESTCKDGCAKEWPPGLETSGASPKAGTGGVKANLLSTTTRSDGTKQVTYNNHPLYRFEGDKKPGETNGQGLTAFGAKWYVVDTAGKAITTPVSSTSPSASASESPSEGASPGTTSSDY
ncbi:hypothetical protein ACFV0C_24240 [Streptomyces sp. NPDC059568]|uniref:COG4315 family predicted lipoprotein n=1 Tax=unclassified Streptomyces TaxID=2593676 RepID=UPI003660857F